VSDALAGVARAWLRRASDDLIASAAELTELDARIGDGDHGINMRRGMEAVTEVLDAAEAETGSADLIRRAGRRIISVVGGASGPLYGTLLISTADELGQDPSDVTDLARALEHGVAAVGRRGRSEVGQKTMLDTLVPAVSVLAASLRGGGSAADAADAVVAAARTGRDSTRDMVAQRGRASYLGERARGHLDPGAASALIVVEALAAVLIDQPATSIPAGASR
jgi:phosphoenolpyruvate---glycerone phosphotransferase subunit DhaL